MKVWWMTINRVMGNSYLGLKHRRVIAQGWPLLGDLTILANNYGAYWQVNRNEFEQLVQLLTRPVYPEDAEKLPKALRNLYNLLSITKGDLVVAVASAKGAGPVMGICQADINAWESYRHDNPDAFDYAHTVCFPVEWVDWKVISPISPRPPAMISGVQPMGNEQASYVQNIWNSYLSI